jgi:CRP-like cAMP-binding protein
MNHKEILKRSFLFRGLSDCEIDCALDDIEGSTESFSRGELVYSSLSEGRIGFILSGRCEVRHIKGENAVAVLNVLGEGDSFGVLSVLSEKEFPTQIHATKNSLIFFLGEQDLLRIVKQNSQIAMNLINFLANRISFLNEKIATISGTRVEDRLAMHLLSESRRLGSLTFPLNCKKCSEAINAGRASVYRALSSLESEGLISLLEKQVNILDLEGLERITK